MKKRLLKTIVSTSLILKKKKNKIYRQRMYFYSFFCIYER